MSGNPGKRIELSRNLGDSTELHISCTNTIGFVIHPILKKRNNIHSPVLVTDVSFLDVDLKKGRQKRLKRYAKFP